MKESINKLKVAAYSNFSDCIDLACKEYDISDSTRDIIKQIWKMRQEPANTTLFQRGSVFDEIWFVSQGAIRSTRLVNGVEQIYSLSVKGQYIGDYRSYLTQQKSLLSFETITDTIFFSANKKDLENIYSTHLEANEFDRHLAEYALSFINQRIIGLQTMTLKERYESLIHSFPEVKKKTYQKDIAAYLGAKPQSLSRMKANLPKKS